MIEELLQAVTKKKVVDVGTNPEEIEVYSGVCLKYTKDIFVLVIYNEDVGNFDGYTLLKGEDILEHRLWDKQDLKDIEDYNIKDFDYKLPLDKLNNFHDSLEFLKKKELIALFIKEEQDHCFVGKIKALNKKEVTLTLIDTGGNWVNDQSILINDIAYIGFDTSYEKELIKKINS